MSSAIRKAFAYLSPDHPTVRAALEEIEQLQKDAANYRFLRDKCGRPQRMRLVDQYDMTKAIAGAMKEQS